MWKVSHQGRLEDVEAEETLFVAETWQSQGMRSAATVQSSGCRYTDSEEKLKKETRFYLAARSQYR